MIMVVSGGVGGLFFSEKSSFGKGHSLWSTGQSNATDLQIRDVELFFQEEYMTV